MTGGPIQRMEVRAHSEAGDLSNVVPMPAEAQGASSAPHVSATNIIPFVRPRREPAASTGADIPFDPAARPAPPLGFGSGRVQIAALLALSLAAHSALYILFTREPEPMASIGLEAISVEFVLGANTPAGPAATPGQQQAQSAPADDPKPTLEPDTTVPKAEEARPVEARAREPQQLAETAIREVRPDRPQSLAQTPPEALKEQAVAVLRAEETPVAREPELTTAPVEPAKPVTAKPEQTKPEPVKTETKPEPKPAPKHEAKPKQEREAQPKQRPGPPQRTASRAPDPTGPHANAASGVGPGRSQLDSNYRGIVFAHLARQKRYPEDARARGEHGSATVNFTLDAGGGVTRVSLVRGTGYASLDQEAVAMVRRASPFPAPPAGHGRNFTAPIGFRAQ